MIELTLAEAALHIGVPPGVLHTWAWAKTVPTANGRLWKPTFDKAVLDQWLAQHRVPLGKSLG